MQDPYIRRMKTNIIPEIKNIFILQPIKEFHSYSALGRLYSMLYSYSFACGSSWDIGQVLSF